jgi:hypothetical protein
MGSDDIPDDNVEDNDGDDDAGLDVVLDGKGQGGDGDEDDGQGVCNLGEEDLPEGGALGALDGVGAVPREAGGSVFRAQPMVDVGAELLSETLGGEGVRKAWLLYGQVGGFRYRGLVVGAGEGRRVRGGRGVGVVSTIRTSDVGFSHRTWCLLLVQLGAGRRDRW